MVQLSPNSAVHGLVVRGSVVRGSVVRGSLGCGSLVQSPTYFTPGQLIRLLFFHERGRKWTI